MNSSKFLKIFALIEALTSVIFISLAVIFFVSKDTLGGDLTIPIIFAFIGVCSLIAAPVLFKLAEKYEPAKASDAVKGQNR